MISIIFKSEIKFSCQLRYLLFLLYNFLISTKGCNFVKEKCYSTDNVLESSSKTFDDLLRLLI